MSCVLSYSKIKIFENWLRQLRACFVVPSNDSARRNIEPVDMDPVIIYMYHQVATFSFVLFFSFFVLFQNWLMMWYYSRCFGVSTPVCMVSMVVLALGWHGLGTSSLPMAVLYLGGTGVGIIGSLSPLNNLLNL